MVAFGLESDGGHGGGTLQIPGQAGREQFSPQLSGTAVPVGFAGTGHAENLLPDRIEHSGAPVVRHIGVRRLPQYDDPMDLPVYQHLSVAAHIRPVQLRAGKDSGTDDAVESSQNECGEEHDARTQTKRNMNARSRIWDGRLRT